MPTRWFLLLVIAAVLAAGVVAARGPHLADGPVSLRRLGSAPPPGPFRFEDLTGRPAPGFSLPDLHGSPHSLSQHRGQVVMLIFWATWCKTCPLELPHLSAIARALAPKGLVTLSINGEKDMAPVMAMARGLAFPVLRDLAERTRHEYDAYSVPRVVIVDRAGVVAAVIRGYQGDTSPVALALVAQGFTPPASAVREQAIPVERVPLSPTH